MENSCSPLEIDKHSHLCKHNLLQCSSKVNVLNEHKEEPFDVTKQITEKQLVLCKKMLLQGLYSQGKSGAKGSFSKMSGKVRECQGKSGKFKVVRGNYMFLMNGQGEKVIMEN